MNLSQSHFFLYNFFVDANKITNSINNISQQSNVKTIQNGSQVLVRVSADKGNGQYEGFVAGTKISFSSKTPLQPGSSFPAIVNFKDGIIQLIIKSQVNTNISEIKYSTNQNEALLQLLKNLGLPQDFISATLLQQMHQLGMKYDNSLFSLLRGLALKIKGKEKLAAEVLMTFYQKGIPLSSEELLSIIMELNGDFDDTQEDKADNSFKKLNEFNGKKGRWYFIPYEIINLKQTEFDNQNIQNSTVGAGCIKLFFNEENEKLLSMGISCSINDKNYYFLVPFDNDFCKLLYMNVDAASDKEKEKMINLLEEKLQAKNIKVIWTEKENIEGTASSFEKIYSFEGKV